MSWHRTHSTNQTQPASPISSLRHFTPAESCSVSNQINSQPKTQSVSNPLTIDQCHSVARSLPITNTTDTCVDLVVSEHFDATPSHNIANPSGSRRKSRSISNKVYDRERSITRSLPFALYSEHSDTLVGTNRAPNSLSNRTRIRSKTRISNHNRATPQSNTNVIRSVSNQAINRLKTPSFPFINQYTSDRVTYTPSISTIDQYSSTKVTPSASNQVYPGQKRGVIMVSQSQTPFQSYKRNYFMQCLTGALGCRWHRYQQSRRTNRKRDVLWFVFFCCTFFYVVFFFFFWLVSANSFDDFNWFLYIHLGTWHPWYSVMVGVMSAVFFYYLILMMLSLCHIGYRQQLFIHMCHLILVAITLVFCITATIVINNLWGTHWPMLVLYLQETGPFLYIGAVAIVTALSWIVAGEWMHLTTVATRLAVLGCSMLVISTLYAVPVLIDSPCVIEQHNLPPRPKIVAHRGASGIAPESTEISFQYAIQYGAIVLETDVHISMDGVPFLMHDTTLSRTTNVEEIYPHTTTNASHYTFAQLERLDAGSWFVDNNPMRVSMTKEQVHIFKDQRIMSFSSFLNLAKGHNKSVYMDRMFPDHNHPFYDNFTDILLRDIKNSGIPHEMVWWNLFYNNITQALDIRDRGFNFTFVFTNEGYEGDVQDMVDEDIHQANVVAPVDSWGIIRDYHSLNISVNFYPINSRWLYSLYWCMGADSVTTDNVHSFTAMTSPVWTMKPTSYVIMWITVDAVSALIIALIFIIQRIRHCEDNPETQTLQGESRSTQNYTETTFQSPGVMKLRLLPSMDSLDSESTNANFNNDQNPDDETIESAITYGTHVNGTPANFTPKSRDKYYLNGNVKNIRDKSNDGYYLNGKMNKINKIHTGEVIDGVENPRGKNDNHNSDSHERRNNTIIHNTTIHNNGSRDRVISENHKNSLGSTHHGVDSSKDNDTITYDGDIVSDEAKFDGSFRGNKTRMHRPFSDTQYDNIPRFNDTTVDLRNSKSAENLENRTGNISSNNPSNDSPSYERKFIRKSEQRQNIDKAPPQTPKSVNPISKNQSGYKSVNSDENSTTDIKSSPDINSGPVTNANSHQKVPNS